MKISNIIIVAFSVFIIGSMLTLFIDAKLHKHKKEELASYKEYPLPAFSVVIAEKGADLHINQSDSMKVSVEYIKGQKTPSKIYEVVNDTLHIYGGLRTFVKCRNIHAIIGQKAYWIGVYKFSPDSLTIKASGGKLYFNNGGIEEKSFNIGIITNDKAYVEIRNSNVNNLSVRSNNAEVGAFCKVKSLMAKLEHTATLHVRNPQNISAQRDTTSQLNMWDGLD